jgi:MFS family permease
MHHASTTYWSRIFLLWLCGIFAAVQFAKISFAFVPLCQWYGVSPAQMGAVLSAVGMMGLVFGVTVGLYAHAIGYRRLLLMGLGTGAALALLQSFMPAFGFLWTSRVLEGASHLAVVVSAPTLIAASSAPQYRSIAMGLWSTFVGVAFALTAALGGVAIAHFGLAGFFRLHALGFGVLWLLAYAMVPANIVVQAANWPRLLNMPRLHFQTYSNWSTALPALCFGCYTSMAIALLTFLPQLAYNDRVWLAVVLPLMSMGGNFCAGWLAQLWLSPLRLYRLAQAGVGIAALSLWLLSTIGLSIAPVALALMFMLGLVGGAAYALIPYLSDAALVQVRANGALAQMGNLGATLGPPLFAALVAALGPLGLVLPVMLFAGLGVVLAMRGARWHADSKNKTAQAT